MCTGIIDENLKLLLQRLYRANPNVAVRKILDDTPPTYCSIPEAELVTHFASTYAAPPPLDTPPSWLVSRPLRDDPLDAPFTPSEIQRLTTHMRAAPLPIHHCSRGTRPVKLSAQERRRCVCVCQLIADMYYLYTNQGYNVFRSRGVTSPAIRVRCADYKKA